MGAIGDPVNPFELVVGWNTLHGFVTDTKNRVLGCVFRKVKLDTRDDREGLFDCFPKSRANPLRSLPGVSRESLNDTDKDNSHKELHKSSIGLG